MSTAVHIACTDSTLPSLYNTRSQVWPSDSSKTANSARTNSSPLLRPIVRAKRFVVRACTGLRMQLGKSVRHVGVRTRPSYCRRVHKAIPRRLLRHHATRFRWTQKRRSSDRCGERHNATKRGEKGGDAVFDQEMILFVLTCL